LPEAKPRAKFIIMKKNNPILLSSGSIRNYGMDRVFEIAAACGYDGVELIVDERTDTVHVDYLRRLIDRFRMPVPVVHAPFEFLDPPGWEKDEVARTRRSVRLAEDLGSESVVLHTPFYTNRSFRMWLENDLPAFQKTTDILLLVENMPCYRKPGGRLGRWLGIADVQQRAPKFFWKLVPCRVNPLCFPLCDLDLMEQFENIILDVTHLATGGYDPIRSFDRFRDKIRHIHLSNFDGREHLEVEAGLIDMAAFLTHIKESGYQGGVCLEIMPEYFPAEDEKKTIALLKRNRKFIRKFLP